MNTHIHLGCAVCRKTVEVKLSPRIRQMYTALLTVTQQDFFEEDIPELEGWRLIPRKISFSTLHVLHCEDCCSDKVSVAIPSR